MRESLPEQQLLERIEEFLSRSGLSAAEFGKHSMRDPNLVLDLREGRELRRSSQARIEAFLDGYALGRQRVSCRPDEKLQPAPQ